MKKEIQGQKVRHSFARNNRESVRFAERWTVFSCLILALGSPVGSRAQLIEFQDVSYEAGVRFEQVAETLVPIGGGAVWADFDSDGWDDVFIAQATGCNRLFMNDRVKGFIDRAAEYGVAECESISHGGGVADLDNDGDQDLYVSNNGQDTLYLNVRTDGKLRFSNVTKAAGMVLEDSSNSASAVWGDYDEDGFVDLFVAQHVEVMEPLECARDLLWHNNGDGTFSEIGLQLEVVSQDPVDGFGCGLAATWSDFDHDGDVDLMVINDFGSRVISNRLYRNDGPRASSGGWLFTDISEISGFDFEMFGMGIATGDVDRDGDLDYYLADVGDNNLARNNNGVFVGIHQFTDIAGSAGVRANDEEIYGGNGLVSWGPVFADVDHDGWIDLFVANGGAPEEKFGDMFGEDYIDDNPNYAYRNLTDSTFKETHDGIGLDAVGFNRAFTSVDYDRDGDLDLYISNLEGPNALFRNELTAGPDTRWLQVDVEGTLSNRDGLGARVTVQSAANESQIREVDGGSSFLSASSRVVHFGMRSLTEVDRVWVEFLNGIVTEHRHVETNRRFRVIEPLALVTSLTVEAVVAPGDEIRPKVSTRNRTWTTQTYDFWVEWRGPSGRQVLLLGPHSLVLEPREVLVERISISIPEGAVLGDHELILRIGDFEQGRVEHQGFIDLTVR